MVKRSRVQEHINNFHRQQEKKIGKTPNGDIRLQNKRLSVHHDLIPFDQLQARLNYYNIDSVMLLQQIGRAHV